MPDEFAYVKDTANLGDSLKDGDIERGFAEADPPTSPEDPLSFLGGPPQDSGFKKNHGYDDEYGFIRRPMYKSDVERN